MVFNLKEFGQEKDYKVYKSRKKVKRKNPDIYFASYISTQSRPNHP
jgi:hypothetical protein